MGFFIFFINLRRMQDQQIRDRIRHVTDKILKRRCEARQNPSEETCQAKLELREVNMNSNGN